MTQSQESRKDRRRKQAEEQDLCHAGGVIAVDGCVRDGAEVSLTAHSKNVEQNEPLSPEDGVAAAFTGQCVRLFPPPSVKLAPSYCLSPPHTRFFASLTSKQRWNPLKQTDLLKNKPSLAGAKELAALCPDYRRAWYRDKEKHCRSYRRTLNMLAVSWFNVEDLACKSVCEDIKPHCNFRTIFSDKKTYWIWLGND